MQQAVNTTPNTFIGGVASTIPDAATLATKLGITESDISYFVINGSDIEAAVNTNYGDSYIRFNDPNITYFRDLGGKANSFYPIFYSCPILKEVEFSGDKLINQGEVSSCAKFKRAIYHQSTQLFFYNTFSGTSASLIYAPNLRLSYRTESAVAFGGVKNVFIPKAEQIGNTNGNENHFSQASSGVNIWANPLLQTSNNDGEEGDLAYARTNKAANIDYSQVEPSNFFIKPSAITNLAHSGGTLTFTPPASTNALDFYEVYVNGFYRQDIAGSGATVSGLVAGNKVTVYACDIYYNRSKSNEITI